MDLAPLETALSPPLPLAAAWQCELGSDALRWSPGVYALFGLPVGAALRREDIVAMYCSESQRRLEALRSAAIAELGSFTFEARIIRPDGRLRWIRVTADIECRGGNPACLYGLKEDITAEVARRGAAGFAGAR